MFGLKSRHLRRRLSAPTSGSARRRARERHRAEQTRAEGERLARERREQRVREKYDAQKQVRENLAAYEPWGRAGGGAPNPRGVRYSNLRATEIYPEDELKGYTQHEPCKRWRSPRRRRPPCRLREDPEVCYADSLRRSVDNDIRYRRTPDQKLTYKQILDEMVEKRQNALRAEQRRDLDYERMMRTVEGPWGRPGPGGAAWRDPKDIGLNFSKSMGWTDNEIFQNLKRDHHKRSSLTLPKVKRDDESPLAENKASNIQKLPSIKHVRRDTDTTTQTKNIKQKTPRKKKFVKRLKNGERINRIDPAEEEILAVVEKPVSKGEEIQLTPEERILGVTGGVELVPLLARRRRVGARTLPSSDVTRPPEQPCEWRELMHMDYLKELKHQMRVKCERREETRRDSAESVRLHHETWASLWGRPGHGAPQRGRYARSNLARLLHVPPLAPPA